MNYLQTRPPIHNEDFESAVQALEKKKSHYMDGKVLATLLRLCQLQGLRTGELLKMTIGDVSKACKVSNSITVAGETVTVNAAAKQLLQEYLNYLQTKGYRRNANNALFPHKFKAPYKSKTLYNHLCEEFFGNFNQKITLEDIRKFAICNHYDHLKSNGGSPEQCLKHTAEFARISEKAVQDLLIDQIKPAGYKPDPVRTYMQQVEKIQSKPLSWKQDNKVVIDKVSNAISTAKDLDEKTREALLNWLEGAKNSKAKPQQGLTTTSKLSLTEIIKKYKSK